jgi:hypothetical protein
VSAEDNSLLSEGWSFETLSGLARKKCGCLLILWKRFGFGIEDQSPTGTESDMTEAAEQGGVVSSLDICPPIFSIAILDRRPCNFDRLMSCRSPSVAIRVPFHS